MQPYIQVSGIGRNLNYTFGVILLSSVSAKNVAKKEENKGVSRYTSTWDFRRRTKNLVYLIKNGELDDILKWKGTEAIWEIMGYNGKLLPKISIQ